MLKKAQPLDNDVSVWAVRMAGPRILQNLSRIHPLLASSGVALLQGSPSRTIAMFDNAMPMEVHKSPSRIMPCRWSPLLGWLLPALMSLMLRGCLSGPATAMRANCPFLTLEPRRSTLGLSMLQRCFSGPARPQCMLQSTKRDPRRQR